jgi:hypothetical protein
VFNSPTSSPCPPWTVARSCPARCSTLWRDLTLRLGRRAQEAEHPGRPDAEIYWREIYPRVKGMQVNHIGQATGPFERAGRITHGQIAPHRRWWEVLAEPLTRVRPS